VAVRVPALSSSCSRSVHSLSLARPKSRILTRPSSVRKRFSGCTVLGPHVVEGEDVRVVERGHGPGLLLEAAQAVGVGDTLRGDDLDRHFAAEARVAGAVDLAHASGAEGREHLVGPEPRAGPERHGNWGDCIGNKPVPDPWICGCSTRSGSANNTRTTPGG
jgi:hypothetical protein